MSSIAPTLASRASDRSLRRPPAAHALVTDARPKVGFLFLGGEHQAWYLAPVAAALGRGGAVSVTAIVASEQEEPAIRRLFAVLGADVTVERLPCPSWARMLAKGSRKWVALKLPRLLAGRARLSRLDLLVVAERTSTVLKRLPGFAVPLVHIPHGAGDRARGFERRIRMFDHVIVSGAKDRNRMIAEGVVTPQRCSVSGHIKLAAVRACKAGRVQARLFANDRPVIFYNPHFSAELGSWSQFAVPLIKAVQGQDRYNLIVAPHVRLMQCSSAEQQRAIEALAVEDKIIIDLGSPRLHDMTYTMASDIYVGDVSSQIYEFLSVPRPCVFLDRGIEGWRDDVNFAAWHLGEVVRDPADVLAAIGRAEARHGALRDVQMRAAQAALDLDKDAVAEAARIVSDLASRYTEQRARR